MKEKKLRLLELKDDELGINKIIDDQIKDCPIELYTDYRDFEGIERLVVNCKTKEDFLNELQSNYDEYISEEQYALTRNIAGILLEAYPGYDEVSNELYEYIQEKVYDDCQINYPFNDYLNHLIKVNMFITYSNSTDAETDDFDKTTISQVLKKLGYTFPKTQLKELINKEYNGNDIFLSTLQREIYNCYPTQMNYLCFIGEITIGEYFKILENPRGTNIKFKHKNYAGFVDPYCGGGSCLELTLGKEQVLTCKGQNVKMLLVEHSGQKYTVDDIYGLTSQCFQRIEVK